MHDRCEIPRCRADADLSYLGHGLCLADWNRLTNENAPPDALRIALGIEAEPELMETAMSKKKIDVKPEATETANAAPEKKAKAPKVEKTKREPKVKEEGLVVFAFRLTPEERDIIHKAAGPGGASRFVRTIAVAAANEDETAIRGAIKGVRELR